MERHAALPRLVELTADGQAAAERLALIREALDELEEELHLDGHVEQPRSKRETRVMRRFRG